MRTYARQRAALVETLREKGIRDERVLAAIAAVPRHRFIRDTSLHGQAYDDVALPIGLDQTISQPFTVAYQTVLLGPQPGERILEVGTGSGYQAAVLAELGARVFSVERHRALLERTNALLAELGYRVRTRLGDGTRGWPALAPFDGIIVTAGGRAVPPALLDQLREPSEGRPGGRLVIPVGDKDGQRMLRITRMGPERFREEAFAEFRFVPLVSDR
ncbi:MAG TPA: protein-L-isoaspartate(D-aspartate) O-methyltransferase [Rubricoccaceae bacterium]|nr:protein-L-isoaspartate(D-aspartate) O-methyltransferase [Rubricoccaceae bacterium]